MSKPNATARALVAVAAVGVVCAGCGGSGAKRATTIPASGTIPHGSVPTLSVPATSATTTPSSTAATTAPAQTGPASTAVTVPGSGSYSLSATPNAGTGACKEPAGPGNNVPFTVSITNTGTVSEPTARINLEITDPEATGKPVASISYMGLCINFTEPDGTLAAGQTITYDGTASGVSSAATLQAMIISTPANDPLGQVSIPLG